MLNAFDHWLQESGPAALVVREYLVPVEGTGGVLFPATFAAGDGFDGGYNIDQFENGANVCLIDSVGSQANRIEPLFARNEYSGLVPQIVIKAGDRKVNLLEAGHRAGDAIVRCTPLQDELHQAFQAVQKGNAERLAKIAPTSIIFGAWDSRDTQAKLPRLIASTIRAYNVHRLTRSAQYVPATDYVGSGLLTEPEDKATRDAYAERGFVHVPASASHGGIIAEGVIQRDASLHLACLRLLNGGESALQLRRYILGLALVAFTYEPGGYLRQGCHLVTDPEKQREFRAVYGDGRREDVNLTHAEAVDYANAATEAFGISPNREVQFDNVLAQKDVSADRGKRQKKAPTEKAKTK